MKQRLYSGSLLGMSQDTRHLAATNPFTRFFLDEPVDGERLSAALEKALSDCPYMRCSVVPEEGIFLAAEENSAPLPLQTKEPTVLNTPENNGHSCAVYYHDNMIGVMVTHALTDGCGFYYFARTLLDHYFGVEEGVYKGASAPDYAKDLLETELPVSPDYKPVSMPEGPFFTIQSPKAPDFSDTFLLQSTYAEFRALCKKLNGSAQNVLTALCIQALSECYPENKAKITARLPINARILMEIPNTFQNASLANMRVVFSADETSDPEAMAAEIASQCREQNTKDAIAYQCNQWRSVLMAEDHEERMKRIVPLLGQDAVLISNLGRGVVSDSYAEHITAMLPGAMLFPLMVYGVTFGQRMGFSGYDAAGNGRYKKALKNVLERMGLKVEECDPATGKAI